MGFHFANPIALLLLLSIVPLIWWARHSMAGLGRFRGIMALALRLLIVILIVLALARTQWSRTEDDMSVIYVVDQSLSIPPNAQEQALEYVRTTQTKRRGSDTVGMVVFGRSAALERRPQTQSLLEMPVPTAQDGPKEPSSTEEASEPEAATIQSVIAPERSNIAAGLRLALAAFPRSGRKRIVLISDGNENLGSLNEELEVARRNGVRIDVKPVTYEYENEVMVEKVLTPANVEKQATFDVRTVVTAQRPQSATLRLYEGDGLVASERVELKAGRNVFTLQRTLPSPGYYAYNATLESPDDTLYANNEANGFTMVHGQGRVLLVEGDKERSQSLYRALANQGMDVSFVGLESLPLGLGQIIPHDVLILSNVSAGNLGQESMRSIELAVKEWGVGLIMVGGENSFGPGGYQDSPVERALPVSMDIKQRRVMPSGALVVILHTCEIPQGNFWAQQIALAALQVLSPTDEYGVILYDWQGGEQWLFPLQKVQSKERLATLIRNAQPGDMPSFINAFSLAHKGLKQSNASIKHVVVISDGDPSYPNDSAITAMVADKITISAVGISPHAPGGTAKLAHVSSIGGGRYYEPTDPAKLPQIFIKEAATVRRALISEEPFKPAATLASEVVKGIDPAEYPALKGYVLTTPKSLAEIPLSAPQQDPLLAHWQYGLGRAVAFTSDAKPRWAADWVSWAKFEQFWVQVVRWCSRKVEDAGLRVQSQVSGDSAHIVIDALDKEGQFLNNLEFTGNVISPEQREIGLKIEQTGPGRYEADIDVNEVGTHFLSLRYAGADGQPRLYTHGLVVPYSAEYAELAADENKLASVAEKTGGRMLVEEDDLFARTFAPEPQYADTWPLLLLASVLLMPLDVFVRRVFVDYGIIWAAIMRFMVLLMPFLGREQRRRIAARPTHVATLLSSKQLTREQIKRRSKKFKPEGEVHVDEPTLQGEDWTPPPKVTPIKSPVVEKREAPAVERADETYLGRLLKAKRAHREESKPTQDKRPFTHEEES